MSSQTATELMLKGCKRCEYVCIVCNHGKEKHYTLGCFAHNGKKPVNVSDKYISCECKEFVPKLIEYCLECKAIIKAKRECWQEELEWHTFAEDDYFGKKPRIEELKKNLAMTEDKC